MKNRTDGNASLIGQAVDRVDGPLKVTGAAKYAAEFAVPNLAHAVAVTSTIAKGTIRSIDDSAATSSPGVLAVITHKNIGHLRSAGRRGRAPAMQDAIIHYAGQYVALVVADTLDQAQFAAQLLKIEYDAVPATVDPRSPIPEADGKLHGNTWHQRGDVDRALDSAAVKIEATYTTPVESHCAMEPHATVAQWDGENLTIYDATQGVMGTRGAVAGVLGIPASRVRVIDPFVGGGFGSKGSVWPHTYLAAIAAQHVDRPVKFALQREHVYTQTGNRPVTIQKITLGADQDGKLVATLHDTISQAGEVDGWVEGASGTTAFLYACPNVKTSQSVVRTNTPAPCQMRAPGHCPGSYGLESAMDELAYAAKIDPLELRLRNYSETDQSSGQAYSTKTLRECYRMASERFGWARRAPQPRTMRDGDLLIGFGMATATYPAFRSSSSASIRFSPNGVALVTTAASDLGTGTYTILAQIAAQELGLPVNRVKVQIGDSTLPPAPTSGGSQTAVTVGSAVQAAAKKLRGELVRLATADESSPLHGAAEPDVVARDGKLARADGAAAEPIDAVFKRNNGAAVTAQASASGGEDARQYSCHSWGAHFAEVKVDPALGHVRVTRYVAAMAAGKILNAKTAANQVSGAIVMGIGMALHEQLIHDRKRGTIVNANLADYLLPVNADIPAIEIVFADETDTIVSPLGAKGIGELGICGPAAAIANAVYHATGKRVRDLPITCDKVMDA